MATPTYTLIDSTVLGSASASVTFSGIAADWRDLVLVAELIGSGTPQLALNSDTTTGNYYWVTMYGTGSSTSSISGNTRSLIHSATGTMLWQIQFQDYSATDKHKSFLVRASDASVRVAANAHRWANTSAITSINLTNPIGDWSAGTSLYLYGIEA